MSERNLVESPLSFAAVLLNLNGNAFFFLKFVLDSSSETVMKASSFIFLPTPSLCH